MSHLHLRWCIQGHDYITEGQKRSAVFFFYINLPTFLMWFAEGLLILLPILCVFTECLGDLIQDLFVRQELSCSPSVVPCLPLHRDFFFFFNAPGAECWKPARPTLEARSSGPGPSLNMHIPWLSLASLTLGLHPSSFNYKEVVSGPGLGVC